MTSYVLTYHEIDLEGKWGMRIESALAVVRVKTKAEFNGDIWLGFERLTCVPIQTRMVKDAMLSKEEKQWLKVCLCLLFRAHSLM
jgi:Xaa-Pro aminopeptidase